MTNKLVAIINSLKVPKIKKILLCEMKFLVPNYSCLQNPRPGGYPPQIPVLSAPCPQLNLLNPPPPNKIPGYATGSNYTDVRTLTDTYGSKWRPFTSNFTQIGKLIWKVRVETDWSQATYRRKWAKLHDIPAYSARSYKELLHSVSWKPDKIFCRW